MSTPLDVLREALASVVRGQREVIDDLVTAIIARGHVLLEGVPGVAKTLAARSLAEALSLEHRRIQFTPDLMPTDVTGTSVFRPNEGTFVVVRGPVFTELLLADELNRTPPKTQAALLEAMEERQVTLDGQTHPLSRAFTVVATQNPLELEGTYPLPEAQLDRFLMRVRVGYPDASAELELLSQFHERRGERPHLAPVLDRARLEALQAQAAHTPCDGSVLEYVVRLVRASREHPKVAVGASPRASQALLAAAKARAALVGKGFVTPDEVKQVAPAVLNHRLLLRPDAELEGLDAFAVLRQLLDRVEVPR